MSVIQPMEARVKPTNPTDTELVFLHEAERRLGYLYSALLAGRNGIPEALGLRSLINNRIAEVQKRREQCQQENCQNVKS